jgi:hypothetical protein
VAFFAERNSASLWTMPLLFRFAAAVLAAYYRASERRSLGVESVILAAQRLLAGQATDDDETTQRIEATDGASG